MVNSVSALGLPYCFARDFNMLLNAYEKRGGQFEEGPAVRRFSEVLHDNSLVDIDFVGPKFTWCRMINGRARLCKRLDRAVASTK